MNWWLFIGGGCFMCAAVLSDPWGKSAKAAALFLLGAALFVIAIATANSP